MKYFFSFIKIAITVISLSACSIDRMRSERLFEQYCNEEGRVGQFIYERLALGEDYFRPIPTDAKELRYINGVFYINNKKLLIDKERFNQSFTRNLFKRKVLSPIGPIYSVESTIVRKSDGKVLSKAVSLLNMLDKTSKYFPVEGVTCPTGRDNKGNSFFYEKHTNLIQNTFFQKNKF